MGTKKPTACVEEGGPTAAAGGRKSKKKNFVIEDDEYSVGTEVSEEPLGLEEKAAPGGGKKKGMKGNAKKVELKEMDVDDDIVMKNVENDEDEMPAVTFGGKKKSKGGNGGSTNKFSALSFGLLGDEGDEDEESGLTQETGGGDSYAEEEDESVLAFTGTEKPSKSEKVGTENVFSASAFDMIGDKDDQGAADDSITRQQSDNDDDDEPVVSFSGKKKKGGRTVQDEDELDKILAELDEAPSISKPDPSPPLEKAQVPPEPADGAGEKEAEERPVESAAAKKKKKKKEKEKEKKAAAAAAATSVSAAEEKQEDAKNKTKGQKPEKKVPKHVIEMQKRLAKLKEAEERKKREEEEKLRREEDERRCQEELERLAEENKRLKKESEKEKLLKKKQLGKLLTVKQKGEARRLEAVRKQILANAGGLPLAADDVDGVPAKRKPPIYQTKKSKPQNQANGSASAEPAEKTESKETQQEIVSAIDSEETEKVDEAHVEEKLAVADVVTESGIEEEDYKDDEDWDAKSWDDTNLKLPGTSPFADEEVDSEPESLVKKEVKNTQPTAQEAVPSPSSSNSGVASQKAPTTTVAPKSLNVEREKGDEEADIVDKNKQKEPKGKKKVSEADTPAESEISLRSPICCIMGHVDTGKTKLLDFIRGTNVQGGEAGGITQQIGATYFPVENICERTRELKADAKLSVPGLLVIDTPGHEAFINLRSRGSGLCDIAILVVDIMHGLEPQTIESIDLLRMRNTEFIVALNKVDRLYGWQTCPNAPIGKAFKQQSRDVQLEFDTRLTHVITQFKEQGLNTELYYKNKEMGETYSIVPTSAISGEGIPDLLLLLVQWTQKTMTKKLTFSNEIQCTVMEVKVVEGHGTTIDVVLANGVLHEGDQIVVCGMQGPIVTTIRALLTPHPMKELRVKGTYQHHKEIKAAQGIKITGQGLEHAIAGTSLYVVGPNDDVEYIMEAAMEDMKSVMSRIDRSGQGVFVQASTLGSLEALLAFLKTPAVDIPVSNVAIGPVHKKGVMKASVMLEKKKEFATILAFDVKVTPEARELADELGVRIFYADIIYHLFDQFKAYIGNFKEERKRESAEETGFPCVLKIIPSCVFNKKDPIILGVEILEGTAKVGTPICIPQRDFIDIGRIASIENSRKTVDYAFQGQRVAIMIVGRNPAEQQKTVGKHFEIEDELVSHISRRSIDLLKQNYRHDPRIAWKLVVKLKKLFEIK